MKSATDTAALIRLPHTHVPRRFVRLSRIVALAIVIGIGIGHVYWSIADWHMRDAGAYWEAAMRLRAGEPLYPAITNVEASEVYRYAPWFAWLTVPFTLLPVQVAGAMWSAVLVAASGAAVLPLVRERAWLTVAFFWPILIAISAGGNVHALLIAMLMIGLPRRSGPMWLAVAASLKAFPLLYVLVYVGRREWAKVAMTALLTAVLTSPMLLYDLTHYPATPGFAGLLISNPVIYAVAIAIAAIAALRWAATRWGWLAASVTVALALPRFFLYDVTFLLVGAVQDRSPQRHRDP